MPAARQCPLFSRRNRCPDSGRSGDVAPDRSVRGHLREEPGEQLLEHLGAARAQDMQVPALRDTPAVQPDRRQGVKVDHVTRG